MTQGLLGVPVARGWETRTSGQRPHQVQCVCLWCVRLYSAQKRLHIAPRCLPAGHPSGQAALARCPLEVLLRDQVAAPSRGLEAPRPRTVHPGVNPAALWRVCPGHPSADPGPAVSGGTFQEPLRPLSRGAPAGRPPGPSPCPSQGRGSAQVSAAQHFCVRVQNV